MLKVRNAVGKVKEHEDAQNTLMEGLVLGCEYDLLA